MQDDQHDIQLKFDGTPVKQLGGAPADVLIGALASLQRILHLIGMKREGRVFGQRVKPSTRVRRDFAIICKAPEHGSHMQPFSVFSAPGDAVQISEEARERLLRVLAAFDSGEAEKLEAAIPDARDRWFFADAAKGLIPDVNSGIQVTVRPEGATRYTFKADRARVLIESTRSGKPPNSGSQKLLCKLKAVDFQNSFVTLQPSAGRAFRVAYPASVEDMLQANPRKRVHISGVPTINAAGDISGFENPEYLSELEATSRIIDAFVSDGKTYRLDDPLRVPATFNFDDNLFTYENKELGIDVYSEDYQSLIAETLREIDVLWRNYATADDEELADDAKTVKRNLNRRFKVSS